MVVATLHEGEREGDVECAGVVPLGAHLNRRPRRMLLPFSFEQKQANCFESEFEILEFRAVSRRMCIRVWGHDVERG